MTPCSNAPTPTSCQTNEPRRTMRAPSSSSPVRVAGPDGGGMAYHAAAHGAHGMAGIAVVLRNDERVAT